MRHELTHIYHLYLYACIFTYVHIYIHICKYIYEHKVGHASTFWMPQERAYKMYIYAYISFIHTYMCMYILSFFKLLICLITSIV
jgi:hypothetical protein